MFGDFFSKKPNAKSIPSEPAREAGFMPPVNQPPINTGNEPDDDAKSFLRLVILVLRKNAVPANDNQLIGSAKFSALEQAELSRTLEALGFFENIETVIMDDWNQAQAVANPAIEPQQFAFDFVNSFHNIKVERVAPAYIQERNKKLLEAYYAVIETIKQIQGWLEDDNLRKRFESDVRKNPANTAALHQCATMFCVISIGCDRIGVYTLIYSLDYRCQAMVSGAFVNKLLRKIFDLTPGGMEVFVRIGSLSNDCIEIMQYITGEAHHSNWNSLYLVHQTNGDLSNPDRLA